MLYVPTRGRLGHAARRRLRRGLGAPVRGLGLAGRAGDRDAKREHVRRPTYVGVAAKAGGEVVFTTVDPPARLYVC